MPFPVKTCVVCAEEFELKPDKPGFANRCPSCSEPEAEDASAKEHLDPEMHEARRESDARTPVSQGELTLSGEDDA